MKPILPLLIAGTLLAGAFPESIRGAGTSMRLVTLGTLPAEVVVELGLKAQLEGMDQSAAAFVSLVPGAKVLNYHRQTSSEGVLSLNPTHVILTDAAGPPVAIRQIRQAGVQMLEVAEPRSWSEVLKNIQTIGSFLGKAQEAAEIVKRMQEQKETVDSLLEAVRASSDPVRVLFVMNASEGGNLLCAGQASGAEAVISMAGAENAATGFEGYKPLTSEALSTLNPDVILYPGGGAHGGGSMGPILIDHPGLRSSPAAKNGRVHGINLTRMLGFGPSLAPQLLELVQFFYPERSRDA